jgi:hypothetical protein
VVKSVLRVFFVSFDRSSQMLSLVIFATERPSSSSQLFLSFSPSFLPFLILDPIFILEHRNPRMLPVERFAYDGGRILVCAEYLQQQVKKKSTATALASARIQTT